MIAFDDQAAVASFLSRHGFGPDISFLPLAGGGRHAVFKVSDGSRRAVLKRHGKPAPTAEHETFERELACHEFVAAHAPESCPAIIGRDAASRSLLFAWVEGTKLRSESVDKAAVGRMAEFLKLVNTPAARLAADSRSLPAASEAGLTPRDHLLTTRRRIATLLGIPDRSEVVAEMKAFVATRVAAAVDRWEVSTGSALLNRSTAPVFSPSDFGFHNVLVDESGRLVFIDFEHAGWDDAAKLCADFLVQPECVLSRELRLSFLDGMTRGTAFADDLAERTLTLLPLQAAKWTLIILNPFLGASTNEELLSERLSKARMYFEGALAEC
jgi:hypothetical protein